MSIIVNAAIKYPDGEIVVSKRHYKIIALQAKLGKNSKDDCIQGFVDSKGNFLTREEAREIALDNGQLNKKHEGELYSEDLWPISMLAGES